MLFRLLSWLAALFLALAVGWLGGCDRVRSSRDSQVAARVGSPSNGSASKAKTSSAAKARKQLKRLQIGERTRAKVALHAHRDANDSTWTLDDDDAEEAFEDDCGLSLDDDESAQAIALQSNSYETMPPYARLTCDNRVDTRPRGPQRNVELPPPRLG